MKSILETIVDAKREEVELLKAQLPLEEVQELARPAGAGSFKSALADSDHVNIIAELKKASPSRGVLMTDFNPVTLARRYSDGGAAALSVLTEEKHFFGRYEYLELARNESGLPVEISVLSEDPAGYNFAKEAIKALKGMRFAPAAIKNVPVRQKLKRRFRFEVN